VQVTFDPQDTTGLSPAFHNKPVAPGVLAVFVGGRRPDRFFAAWLMAGELGLPLVQAPVAVSGCVAFIDGGAVANAQTLPGSVVILSQDSPEPGVLPGVDLAIQFSAAGRPGLQPPVGSAPAGPRDRIDPGCNFNVVIGGVDYGLCQAGAPSSVAYGSRGNVYPNLVLRRAITLDPSLYEWRMNLVAAQADVRTMALQHLDASGSGAVIRTWWMEGAWPVRWTGPSFDSMASTLAMEEVEIRITRFDWLLGGK
jgi:phage tail-like protein